MTDPDAAQPQPTPQDSAPPARWAALPLWILLCFAAPIPAALWPPGAWYAALSKPSWTPPAWVFGPVWTTLYAAMGVAAWRVWRRDGWSAGVGLFLAQLAVNAVWSPVFFGWQQLGIAFAVILVLAALIALTLGAFWRSDRLAGALLMPYLAWASFAACLNFALWRLNA